MGRRVARLGPPAGDVGEALGELGASSRLRLGAAFHAKESNRERERERERERGERQRAHDGTCTNEKTQPCRYACATTRYSTRASSPQVRKGTHSSLKQLPLPLNPRLIFTNRYFPASM